MLQKSIGGALAAAAAAFAVFAVGLMLGPQALLADDGVRTSAEVVGASRVTIDIKPGSNPNSIDLPCRGSGVIPVALVTTAEFDACTVDPSTVRFAQASSTRSAMEDVDGDGDLDIVLQFKCRELNIARDATVLCLQGAAPGGISIEGCDSVRIVSEHEPGRGDAPPRPITTPAAVAGPGAASPRGSGPRAIDDPVPLGRVAPRRRRWTEMASVAWARLRCSRPMLI